MAQIKNLNNRTTEEINSELANGAKFVIFQYTISILVMTFKRPSDVYFIPSGESATKHSLKYSLLSFVLGWWGIPWGPIYTIGSLGSNFSGGKDVTRDVINHFNRVA